MASFSETGTKLLEYYFQCFNKECLKCSGLVIPTVAARPLPHARQGLPRLLQQSKTEGWFPIPGSLEVGEKSCIMRQLFWRVRSMFLIKWHQEVLQDFLFKDLIRSYLLFMSCFIPFPIQSCQEKSKTLHFLLPPLFQWI